jgi:hypothetical protein
MKPLSRKRAPNNLPPAVSDLVAEGGNVLASDDASVRAVTPAAVVDDITPSRPKARPPRGKTRTAATN